MADPGHAVAPITPVGFIKKWSGNLQSERRIAQAHFNDLCRLLNHPTPAEDDPSGDHFSFEKAATKIGGGKGFADVWKENHFAWEYKSRGENLETAHQQLVRYAPALGNPPLQVVCDFKRFRIFTAWTNTLTETHDVTLDELVEPDRLRVLRHVFHDPDKLKPIRVRSALTQEAANKFATIAFRLQGRGSTEEIAHFVNQLVFCFFADSVELLPKGLWSKLLMRAQEDPAGARGRFDGLFAAMRKGEDYGAEKIVHFNGGLFDGQRALRLDDGDIGLLRAANSLDWSLIDPSIFGSLFERFLDPKKRAQIGAHYTDAEKIEKIIEPVIMRPLREEWTGVKADIRALLSHEKKTPKRARRSGRMKPLEAAEERRAEFLKRLSEIKILDPACGSGNFLYLALQGVKDIEHQINIESEKLGLKPQLPFIGPEILKGIEINPIAAELARTTIWIGDVQWRIRNGIHSHKPPVLKKLDAIECRDALVVKSINGECAEADWPKAEFIVGNPPFLGSRKMQSELGSEYVEELRHIYRTHVATGSDLVCFFFAKAWDSILRRRARQAGLVATNSIAGGTSRGVLKPLAASSRIFEAWRDEPWIIEGADVRVAIICFGDEPVNQAYIDGRRVRQIFADLRGSGASRTDLTQARALSENKGVSFQGVVPRGNLQKKRAHDLGLPPAGFVLSGSVARTALLEPLNPNGRPNSDVIVPFLVGDDLVGVSLDRFIVDFQDRPERDAALYQTAYKLIVPVKLHRSEMAQPEALEKWWQHWRVRPEMRAALKPLRRFIATSRVAKYRLFVWRRMPVLPDNAIVTIAREDDVTFGILHSRFHERWSLRLGTRLGVGNDPRYTPTTTLETYPFPEGLTPNVPAEDYASSPRARAIARAAKGLDGLRNAWLNPPDLICIEPEVVPGYPDRIVPKDAIAAVELKRRTLTNLYNQRPQWLDNAHRDLDAAVAAAYGWAADISEDEALAKLLELNLSRAGVAAESTLLAVDERADET